MKVIKTEILYQRLDTAINRTLVKSTKVININLNKNTLCYKNNSALIESDLDKVSDKKHLIKLIKQSNLLLTGTSVRS